MTKRSRRSVAELTPMVAEKVERLRSVCDESADKEGEEIRQNPVERYAWLGKVLLQAEQAHGVLSHLVVRDHNVGREIQLQSWQLAVVGAINACANVGGLIAAEEMGKPRALTRWKPVDQYSYVVAIATLAMLLDRRIVTLTAEDLDRIKRTAKVERRAENETGPTAQGVLRYLVDRGVITPGTREWDVVRTIGELPPPLLSVGRAARALSVRLHVLNRIMRRARLPSPARWVVLARALRAQRAILVGASVHEAAQAAGYYDQAGLSNALRRTIGFRAAALKTMTWQQLVDLWIARQGRHGAVATPTLDPTGRAAKPNGGRNERARRAVPRRRC